MASEAALIDTGPLVALYNQRDPRHADCRDALESIPFGKAYTCWPVLTEAAYLLRHRAQQREDLLHSVVAGDLVVLRLRDGDIQSVLDVFTKYHDQEIDLADACLLHLSEREGIDTVVTLDRRHFSVLRKLDGNVLNMLPAD